MRDDYEMDRVIRDGKKAHERTIKSWLCKPVISSFDLVKLPDPLRQEITERAKAEGWQLDCTIDALYNPAKHDPYSPLDLLRTNNALLERLRKRNRVEHP